MSGCVKCGNDNKPGAKFCKFCGEGMAPPQAAAVCLSCAAPLQPGAKFCKQCGTAVAVSDPVSAATPAPVAAPEIPVAAPVVIKPLEVAPEIVAETAAAEADAVVAPPVVIAPLAAAEPVATATQTAADDAEVVTPAPVDVVVAPKAPSALPKIIAVLCVVAVIAAGGGFYAFQRNSAEVPAAPQPAAAAPVPAPANTAPEIAAPAEPVPAQPVAVAAPAPVAEPAPAKAQKVEPPVRAAPATPARAGISPQAPAKGHPGASSQVTPDAAENMARKVSSLLAKANGYVENKQYDKAIATAETVLELDPGSNAAHAMISKAKTRQLDALRSGSTLE